MYVKSVLEDSYLRIFAGGFKKANEIQNYATRLSLKNSVNQKQKPMADTPLSTNVPPLGKTY